MQAHCSGAVSGLSFASPTSQEDADHIFQHSFIASFPPSASSLEKHKTLTSEIYVAVASKMMVLKYTYCILPQLSTVCSLRE
jgi:hypothetical protein